MGGLRLSLSDRLHRTTPARPRFIKSRLKANLFRLDERQSLIGIMMIPLTHRNHSGKRWITRYGAKDKRSDGIHCIEPHLHTSF